MSKWLMILLTNIIARSVFANNAPSINSLSPYRPGAPLAIDTSSQAPTVIKVYKRFSLPVAGVGNNAVNGDFIASLNTFLGSVDVSNTNFYSCYYDNPVDISATIEAKMKAMIVAKYINSFFLQAEIKPIRVSIISHPANNVPKSVLEIVIEKLSITAAAKKGSCNTQNLSKMLYDKNDLTNPIKTYEPSPAWNYPVSNLGDNNGK